MGSTSVRIENGYHLAEAERGGLRGEELRRVDGLVQQEIAVL